MKLNVIGFIICIIVIIFVCALQSCSTQYRCTPSRRSKDYAKQQWITQRSDGYWIVTTMHKFKRSNVKVFECKPDSIQLSFL